MKNLTAVGKYLILMVTLGSVAACSSTPPTQSTSVDGAVVREYHNPVSSVAVLYNLFQYNKYSLNEEQKRKQTAAVYAALESDYGQVYSWYEYDARGAVKAVHGYPQGSGFCRVIYSTIEVDGVQRNYEETACQEAGHNGWRFVHKTR